MTEAIEKVCNFCGVWFDSTQKKMSRHVVTLEGMGEATLCPLCVERKAAIEATMRTPDDDIDGYALRALIQRDWSYVDTGVVLEGS